MSTEKQKFATRLNGVLDDSGYPKAGHGRQSALATVMGESATQVGRWLKGEDYPKTSMLVKMAQHLGVRSNWLLTGAGEKFSSASEPEKEIHIATRSERESGVGDIRTVLSQEAFELALSWMQLPQTQRHLLQKLIMELAKDQ